MTHRPGPRWFLAIACIAAAALSLAVRIGLPPAVVAQEEPRDAVVGVLRADGILLPFAAYDGRRWSSPWPSSLSGLALPVNLAAIPRRWWGGEVPSEWRLWPIDGTGAPAPFSLVAPIMVPVGTARRLGVRTTHAPPAPPVPLLEFPFPKHGLAVAGSMQLDRVAIEAVSGEAAAAMLESVREAVNAAEELTVRRLRSEARWRHPFERPARHETSLELEAWYATPVERGGRASYIEVARRYPALPQDEGCGLVTFVTGWVHHEPRRPRPRTDLRAVVTYCDRDKAVYMLPFGSTVLRGRTYWFFQLSGPEVEWYVVAEIRPGRATHVAEFPAGTSLEP